MRHTSHLPSLLRLLLHQCWERACNKAMSVNNDKGAAHLRVPLLEEIENRGTVQGLDLLETTEEAVLSEHLDSSRVTLNHTSSNEHREREFGAGIIVELSKPDTEPDRGRLSQYVNGSIDEGEDLDDLDDKLPINTAVPADSVACQHDMKRTKWEEAALYVREGEDDAKFYHHPTTKWSKMAYDVLHHPAYHVLHFLISVLLLLLALAETPAVGEERLSKEAKEILTSIHATLEILFLSLLGIDLIIRFFWLGCSHFFRQRTVIITAILAVMYVEALTVLIRQQSHIRITRLLRPVFFVDTYYMVGVRRVIRQIFQSIQPIVDVVFLLLFFIILFALFGYLIFSQIDPVYFNDVGRSFVSLFIAQTTANNPDVMMEPYSEHDAAPVFFVVYILISLYFSSNVLLAVVYISFSQADKKKFKKLFFHKRDALYRAFLTLGYDDPSSETLVINFHDFLCFMGHYRPWIPEWQVMCIYKALQKDPQKPYQGIDLKDFSQFYEVIDYKWQEVNSEGETVEWFHHLPASIGKPVKAIHVVVTHKAYKFLIGTIALVNLIFLLIYTIQINESDQRFIKLHRVLPVSFIFLSIYIVDILLNIISRGPYKYFRKFWNMADFIMVLFSLICLCIESNPKFAYLAVFRPLKLLRLVRLKGRYRDIMNTIIELTPRLLSVMLLLVIIYYAFAITGMEFLFDKVHQGCCNTSWYEVRTYYSEAVSGPDDTDTVLTYYLNNFNNILKSYVTLFILMVVNNWYIIMEGFVSEVKNSHRWLTRIYFMSFYIITLIVLQVVITFMLEAFTLKIEATRKRRVCTKHPNSDRCDCKKVRNKKTVTIQLVEEDIAKLRYEAVYFDERHRLTLNKILKWSKRINFSKVQNRTVTFVGQRLHTKEDVHILLYADEIKNWDKMVNTRNIGFKHNPRKGGKIKEETTLRGRMKSIAMTVLLYLME